MVLSSILGLAVAPFYAFLPYPHLPRTVLPHLRLHWAHPDMEKAMDPTPVLFCLENPMDGGAWWTAVHGIAKSRTRLSDFSFTFHFRALEKEMATHSSVLAWRIPETVEPGGLPSMGSQSDVTEAT